MGCDISFLYRFQISQSHFTYMYCNISSYFYALQFDNGKYKLLSIGGAVPVGNSSHRRGYYFPPEAIASSKKNKLKPFKKDAKKVTFIGFMTYRNFCFALFCFCTYLFPENHLHSFLFIRTCYFLLRLNVIIYKAT